MPAAIRAIAGNGVNVFAMGAFHVAPQTACGIAVPTMILATILKKQNLSERNLNENEILKKGSSYDNDYGPSFYLTLEFESTKEWACKNNESRVVNNYSIRK